MKKYLVKNSKVQLFFSHTEVRKTQKICSNEWHDWLEMFNLNEWMNERTNKGLNEQITIFHLFDCKKFHMNDYSVTHNWQLIENYSHFKAKTYLKYEMIGRREKKKNLTKNCNDSTKRPKLFHNNFWNFFWITNS